MKITLIFGCALLLTVTGCKRETQTAQQSTFPGVVSNGLPGVASAEQPPVTEWSKVKIGSAGDIFVNKKQMSLAEFSTECARLKKVGGAIVLFIDTPNHVASPAQAEAMRKIVDAGVAMKAALKESDLE
jgi:biopolymer transport protein ExbD